MRNRLGFNILGVIAVGALLILSTSRLYQTFLHPVLASEHWPLITGIVQQDYWTGSGHSRKRHLRVDYKVGQTDYVCMRTDWVNSNLPRLEKLVVGQQFVLAVDDRNFENCVMKPGITLDVGLELGLPALMIFILIVPIFLIPFMKKRRQFRADH